MATVVLFLVIMASSALAQVPSNQLSPAQCEVLKADISADPSLNTVRVGREDQRIADAYNLPASPLYWVSKPKISKGEMLFTKSIDNTSFTFVGNGYITRSPGELAAFRELFDVQDVTSCALPNVIQALQDIFSGTGNAAANRTHLSAMCRRAATRGEKVFVNTTGCAGTAAAPCVLVFEGSVRTSHVACALNIP